MRGLRVFCLDRLIKTTCRGLKTTPRARICPGFTLIEVVVYLSLLLILSVALGRISTQLREFSAFSHRAIDGLLQKELLVDQIRRDMVTATADVRYWDVDNHVFRQEVLCTKRLFATTKTLERLQSEEERLLRFRSLFHTRLKKLRVQTKDVGYVIKDGSVYRLEGVYDYEKKAWSSPGNSSGTNPRISMPRVATHRTSVPRVYSSLLYRAKNKKQNYSAQNNSAQNNSGQIISMFWDLTCTRDSLQSCISMPCSMVLGITMWFEIKKEQEKKIYVRLRNGMV